MTLSINTTHLQEDYQSFPGQIEGVKSPTRFDSNEQQTEGSLEGREVQQLRDDGHHRERLRLCAVLTTLFFVVTGAGFVVFAVLSPGRNDPCYMNEFSKPCSDTKNNTNLLDTRNNADNSSLEFSSERLL